MNERMDKLMGEWTNYHTSLNNSWELLFFLAPKGGDYLKGAMFSLSGGNRLNLPFVHVAPLVTG